MKLSREDWVRNAGIFLTKNNIDALKVEALARDMGVSKGSFYWHFKNRADLLNAIIERWEAETAWLIAESRKAGTPRERLMRLFHLIADMAGDEGLNIDTALFMWAQRAPDIAKRVRNVETQRVNSMAEILRDAGLPPEEAMARSELVYLAFLGFVHRANRDPAYQSEEKFRTFGEQMVNLLFTNNISTEVDNDPT